LLGGQLISAIATFLVPNDGASLAPHVLHVVVLGADEQMMGIDAYPVVAPMQYAAAVRSGQVGDRPEVQFPANPMRCALELVEGQYPISGFSWSELPRPAFVLRALVDIGPELGRDVFIGRQYAVT